MVLSHIALVSALLIGAPQPAAPSGSTKSGASEISKDQAATLIGSCGSRRFEATADVPVNGKLRRTKVTLCAADGDTSAQWISKLEKAVSQIDAHPTFPDATKMKLILELRAEIARVKPTQSASIAANAVPFMATPPAASAPPVPIAGSPRIPPKSPLADFSPLPPMPRARTVAASSSKIASPARRGPQLTVQCALVGVDRAQRCGVIATDERLVVRATEPFNGPVTLRFTRSDSESAEVPFASQSLRAGQTARISVPKAICARRIRAEFEIEAVTPVINGGRSGERLGSFAARCGA